MTRYRIRLSGYAPIEVTAPSALAALVIALGSLDVVADVVSLVRCNVGE